MAERLAEGNLAVALLANAVATGGGLFALIATFGALSGAHFNPIVSLHEAWRGNTSRRAVPAYVLAQLGGAVLGVVLAHAMFELPLVMSSSHVRTGLAVWIAEAVATAGLLLVITGTSRRADNVVLFAVPAYIVAAYWAPSSPSFANPAVPVARALPATFAGISARRSSMLPTT